MPSFSEMFCECCGRSAEEVLITMTFTKDGETEILCEMCDRHVKWGTLRHEYIDGVKHWRVWQQDISPWKPTDRVSAAVLPK